MSGRRAAWRLGALLFVLVAGGLWWLLPAVEQSVPMAQRPQEPVASPLSTAESPATPKPVVIDAVTRDGIAVHIVKRIPLRRPDPPYGPAYRELLPRAQGGSSSAQYELGLLLYECRNVPTDEPALEHEIDEIQQTRRHGSWDVSDPEAEVLDLRREHEDCVGVPAEARGQYRDWLRSAADSGLLEAQLDMMNHLPQREYCQYLYQCTPDQRAAQEALQVESLHYMTLARDAGSVSALWTFGAWYQNDEVLPINDVEAYAHFSALDQIQAAAGQGRRFESMMASIGAKLRPVDLAQAQVRAQELLSNPNCCVISP